MNDEEYKKLLNNPDDVSETGFPYLRTSLYIDAYQVNYYDNEFKLVTKRKIRCTGEVLVSSTIVKEIISDFDFDNLKDNKFITIDHEEAVNAILKNKLVLDAKM